MTLHAIPGMGADRRMYPSVWAGLPGFVAHDWPPVGDAQTVADVARVVCEAWNIQDGDSLIGVSLGGMVACEITRLRKIKTLCLVGSAVRKDEISAVLAWLSPLADVTPVEGKRGLLSEITRCLT